MEETSLNPEEDRITHRLAGLFMRVSHLQRSFMEREFSSTGVYRGQHQILMCLARNPEATQKDIARFHDVSTATIAVSLKKMEKAGYIEREMDEKDNRCNRLKITKKGQEVVDKSCRIFHHVEDTMFAGFSEEELREMQNYLQKIRENMKAVDEGELCKSGALQPNSKED